MGASYLRSDLGVAQWLAAVGGGQASASGSNEGHCPEAMNDLRAQVEAKERQIKGLQAKVSMSATGTGEVTVAVKAEGSHGEEMGRGPSARLAEDQALLKGRH